MPLKKRRGKRTTKNSATSPRAIKTAKMKKEALEYRMQGYNFESIGDQLGVSTTRAFELVTAAMADMQTEGVEELRKMAAARLDLMLPTPLSNAAQGDLNSINAVLRIEERRARLLGLDAPERKELTGKDGKPIETKVEVDDEAAFKALAEALAKAGYPTEETGDTSEAPAGGKK